MNIPENQKYTKEHEWLRVDKESSVDGKTVAYIGITDYAQGELGEIVYVEVETVGETVAKDEIFGTVEAVKTTSDLYLPVSAEILEFNTELDESEGDNPALLNEDPYGMGWIVKISLTDISELEGLMDASAYSDLIS